MLIGQTDERLGRVSIKFPIAKDDGKLKFCFRHLTTAFEQHFGQSSPIEFEIEHSEIQFGKKAIALNERRQRVRVHECADVVDAQGFERSELSQTSKVKVRFRTRFVRNVKYFQAWNQSRDSFDTIFGQRTRELDRL